ncbi:hypothetical protein ACVJBD_000527 [Rhizobium mongolense]
MTPARRGTQIDISVQLFLIDIEIEICSRHNGGTRALAVFLLWAGSRAHSLVHLRLAVVLAQVFRGNTGLPRLVEIQAMTEFVERRDIDEANAFLDYETYALWMQRACDGSKIDISTKIKRYSRSLADAGIAGGKAPAGGIVGRVDAPPPGTPEKAAP